MPKFSKENSERRRIAKQARRLSLRVLIVCGAAETEKQYLEGVKGLYRNPAVAVKIKTRDKSPLEVVRYAAAFSKSDKDDFDEVWAVFDVDEFDVTEAVREAAKSNVNVAVSNPCFEFWLLLHFVNRRGHLNSYKQANALLCKHLRDYDKAQLDCANFQDKIDIACARAKDIDETREKPYANPSSGMWRVIGQISPGSHA
ncbi:RloB family protein [Sphaerisporangium sp. NPDC051017]|uniref:RloB family protein n=1 Tax=Sphaerisporangium sp. NPDC051017 TaxID=3154636 RepID=UPI00343603B1